MSFLRQVWVLAALALAFVSTENTTRYDDYVVLRFVPKKPEHFKALASLRNDPELEFWQDSYRPILRRQIILPVDVLVSPKKLRAIKKTFKGAQIDDELLLNDLQALIDIQMKTFLSPKAFGWDDYQPLDAIHKWLKTQAVQHNKIATIITAGQSAEGRPLLGLRIAHKPNLPIVFVQAGIHAREWIGPATATWFIQRALNATDELTKSYEWHVFPSVNPDGYVYTQKDRFWKKSRKRFGSNIGVDLNRNFPFQWNGSVDACPGNYPGPAPASEPETQGLMTYLNSVLKRTRVYISLQSYNQVLMYPWAYTKDPPRKRLTLKATAGNATEALRRRYGTWYLEGTHYHFFENMFGTPSDYAYSLNINYTFVFGLRDRGGYGMLLPKEEIVPTALETFDAVSVILQRARKAKN